MSVKAQMRKIEQETSEVNAETTVEIEVESSKEEAQPASNSSIDSESKFASNEIEAKIAEYSTAKTTDVVETVETQVLQQEANVETIEAKANETQTSDESNAQAIDKNEVAPNEEAPENNGKPTRTPRRGRGKPVAKQSSPETKAPVELPAAILAQQEKLRLEQEEKRKAATSRRRSSAGRVKNDPRLAREQSSEVNQESNVE